MPKEPERRDGTVGMPVTAGSEWALVTGASAGIGREFATILAEHRFNLVLVARNQGRLKDLARELGDRFRVSTRVLAQDLALPDAASQVFEKSCDLPVSFLVNNAGFGHYGEFAAAELKLHTSMLQVNIRALLELSHLFLQPMLRRRAGKVLNVASVAAFQPGPTVNVYYASKAFVYSFSYALAAELENTGVTVTTLCPGTTRTEFFERGGIRMSRPWPMMSARAVAEAGFRGAMRGKRVVIPGLMNRIMASVSAALPSRLTSGIVRRVHLPANSQRP